MFRGFSFDPWMPDRFDPGALKGSTPCPADRPGPGAAAGLFEPGPALESHHGAPPKRNAAAGTVVGRCAGVITGFALLYSGRFRLKLLPGTFYRPDPALVCRILRIGIPSALQVLFRNGSVVIFVKLLALTEASTAAVAAFSIAHQMERIQRRSSLSFDPTATTLAGQNMGADEPQPKPAGVDPRRQRAAHFIAQMTLAALVQGQLAHASTPDQERSRR